MFGTRENCTHGFYFFLFLHAHALGRDRFGNLAKTCTSVGPYCSMIIFYILPFLMNIRQIHPFSCEKFGLMHIAGR